MAARPRGHKQRKLNDTFIHFFCLCALGLVIKLNFIISKVAFWQKIGTCRNKVFRYPLNIIT